MNNIKVQKYVSIKNNSVSINGTEVYKSDPNDPINIFLKKVYKEFRVSYSKFFKMDLLSKLGFLNAEILLDGLLPTGYSPNEYGIFIANSSSSLETDIKFHESLNTIPSPSVFVYTLPNIVIGEICIRHNFKGECSFFIQEKPDYDSLTNYASYVLNTTQTKHAIIGWIDVNPNGEFESNLAFIENKDSIDYNSKIKLKKIFNN